MNLKEWEDSLKPICEEQRIDFSKILEEYRKISEKIKMFKEENFDKFVFSNNFELNKMERFKCLHCDSFPPTLQIELTNRCNLKCSHCGVITRKDATLPREVFDKMENTLFAKINDVTWLGGEVFLVEYFFELIERLNFNFPHLGHRIYTNGLLINEEIANFLANIKNLQLKFSIDSVVKETYEKIRSLGKYDILINNLSLLNETYKRKNKKPNLSINVIVMKSNLEQLVLYPDFCKKYGISYLDVSFLSDVEDACNPENLFAQITSENVIKTKIIIKEVERKCREYNIKFFCNFSYAVDISNNSEPKDDVAKRRAETYGIVKKQTQSGVEYVYQCCWPWHSMYIKSSGLVVPTGDCIVPIGNILNDSIDGIWNSEVMKIYRYKMINSDLKNWCNYHCQRKSSVNKQLINI